MKKLLTLLFLASLITTLGNCRSTADRIRAERNAECSAVTPLPPRLDLDTLQFTNKGVYAPAKSYNEWVDHAASLADCLTRMRCSERLSEWERDCAEFRVTMLEESWFPGALYPRLSCPISRPICKVDDDA